MIETITYKRSDSELVQAPAKQSTAIKLLKTFIHWCLHSNKVRALEEHNERLANRLRVADQRNDFYETAMAQAMDVINSQGKAIEALRRHVKQANQQLAGRINPKLP